MGQFNLYPLTNSIDAVQDKLLIYNNASGTLKTINRNTFEGLASQPLGLTDTQNPQNKTFDNTNAITIKDGSFTIQNSSSTTKQAVLSAVSITAGQTRTITIPDASGTLALLGSNQTFSGVNIFSGSTWTGGTISNATIAADTITGFTTSNSGNIYGIPVTTGVITGSNVIANGALKSQSVNAGNLSLSSGFTGGVTSYTNGGSAGGTFYYINLGGIKMLWGQSAAVATGAAYAITLPASFFSTIQLITGTPGTVSGTAAVLVSVSSVATSTISMNLIAASGSGTMPFYVQVIGT